MDASSTTFTSKLGYGKHEWTQNRLTEIIQLYNVLYTLHKDGRLWNRLGRPVYCFLESRTRGLTQKTQDTNHQLPCVCHVTATPSAKSQLSAGMPG